MHEHQLLSRAVDFAVMYDGLNAPNLGCIEVLIRRMQLLESAHLDDPKAPNYEGGDLFMGHGDRPGGVLIAPDLRTHVATRLRDDASVRKEQRKAKEERRLARGGREGGRGRGRGGGGEPAPKEQ